jgi:hypothetical protein
MKINFKNCRTGSSLRIYVEKDDDIQTKGTRNLLNNNDSLSSLLTAIHTSKINTFFCSCLD